MSGKFDNFRYYFNDIQDDLREIAQKKNSLKNKLKDFIFSFQMMDSRIQKTLFIARDFYMNKRYYYKLRINNLKKKKIETKKLWTRYSNEIKKLTIPSFDENISKSIGFLKYSLKDIKFKINNLNKKLEAQILDINAENKIIELLLELEEEEKQKTNELLNLEQSQAKKIKSSEYYQTQRRIEDLELKLTEIYNDLKKWSNRLLHSHKKMFILYRQAKKFEDIKKNINIFLVDNKNTTNYYNQLFSDLMKENNDNLVKELMSLEKIKKAREKARERKTSSIKYIIEKKRTSKKLIKEKLTAALEKQKSGKKLDFYELKLILDSQEK